MKTEWPMARMAVELVGWLGSSVGRGGFRVFVCCGGEFNLTVVVYKV